MEDDVCECCKRRACVSLSKFWYKDKLGQLCVKCRRKIRKERENALEALAT